MRKRETDTNGSLRSFVVEQQQRERAAHDRTCDEGDAARVAVGAHGQRDIHTESDENAL